MNPDLLKAGTTTNQDPFISVRTFKRWRHFMLKRGIFLLIAVFTVMATANDSSATNETVKKACCTEKSETVQTTCPVMGGEIKKDMYLDHDGNRIYFCCQACAEKFKEDPDAYIQKMKDANVILQKSPCCESGECEGCQMHKNKEKSKI
jgi:YHS domain-containing protein